MVEESEFITVGNVMFTIIDLDPIKIQGYLSEFDVNKVSLGTKAVIENTNGIKKNGVISHLFHHQLRQAQELLKLRLRLKMQIYLLKVELQQR